MIGRFLAAQVGPTVKSIGDTPLERFALQAYLGGKLGLAELRMERMMAGHLPWGMRLVVLALLARWGAGYPRASGEELIQEVEILLSGGIENPLPLLDLDAHRASLQAFGPELIAAIRNALAELEQHPERGVPLFGNLEQDPLPLVCREGNSFSFARLLAAEQRLVSDLTRRLKPSSELDPARIATALQKLDSLPSPHLNPGQRTAVEAALHHSFLIVTGGPGTGKTTVVSRILWALAQVLDGLDSEAVALCAPTGRAKARLAETVGQNLSWLSNLDPRVAALLPSQASTLHSLLGARSDGTFRHHPGNPLPQCVVVLDEASMVDLVLFAALLAALSPEARLIVVGDPDQLPSVEAGAVLADLVANPHFQDKRIHLLESHRNTGDIAEICGRIRQGQPVGEFLSCRSLGEEGMALVRSRVGGVGHLGNRGGEEFAVSWLEERFGHPMRERGCFDPDALLQLVERSRILCAVHEGVAGAQTLNRRADHWLRERFPSPWNGRFVPGQQVMLTRNLPARDLWNGDLGVVLEHEGRMVAAFPKFDGILRVPVEQLDGLESAWAITIHKSQGSEFDEVLVMLPDRDVPVLTRQILYTAISRARRTVVVHGDLDLVAKAIERSADRPSRLREV